mmetsp:Transcript_3606/g.11377  ORF Transcript_3606/g.11377 Transcript_3606/m.11377 type:complete len:300 (+) Transcript_3606:121-1020(+)
MTPRASRHDLDLDCRKILGGGRCLGLARGSPGSGRGGGRRRPPARKSGLALAPYDLHHVAVVERLHRPGGVAELGVQPHREGHVAQGHGPEPRGQELRRRGHQAVQRPGPGRRARGRQRLPAPPAAARRGRRQHRRGAEDGDAPEAPGAAHGGVGLRGLRLEPREGREPRRGPRVGRPGGGGDLHGGRHPELRGQSSQPRDPALARQLAVEGERMRPAGADASGLHAFDEAQKLGLAHAATVAALDVAALGGPQEVEARLPPALHARRQCRPQGRQVRGAPHEDGVDLVAALAPKGMMG